MRDYASVLALGQVQLTSWIFVLNRRLLGLSVSLKVIPAGQPPPALSDPKLAPAGIFAIPASL
jgi:hypothetical protein